MKEEVEIIRDRYGYKIGAPGKKKTFYRRVTTHLQGLPKPALPRWSANTVAAFALAEFETIAGMLDGIDPEAVKAAGAALLKKEPVPKGDSQTILEAVYDLLRNEPWAKRDAAADRGSAVHAAIESYLLGRPLPDTLTTEDELDCAIAAETFLKNRNAKILGVELTVISVTHGYAGTLDLWDVVDGGERWITDWKTSGAIYPEHAVQQVAYKMAEYAVVDKEKIEAPTKSSEAWRGRLIEWGPDHVDRIGIVHVTPEAATLKPIRPNVEKRLWTAYRAAKHIKEFQSESDNYYGEAKLPVYEV